MVISCLLKALDSLLASFGEKKPIITSLHITLQVICGNLFHLSVDNPLWDTGFWLMRGVVRQVGKLNTCLADVIIPLLCVSMWEVLIFSKTPCNGIRVASMFICYFLIWTGRRTTQGRHVVFKVKLPGKKEDKWNGKKRMK